MYAIRTSRGCCRPCYPPHYRLSGAAFRQDFTQTSSDFRSGVLCCSLRVRLGPSHALFPTQWIVFFAEYLLLFQSRDQLCGQIKTMER